VAERVGGRFEAGVVFVALAGVTEPGQVLGGIGRALGVELAGADAPLQALVEQLGGDRWLLVVDNLEQVLAVAADLTEVRDLGERVDNARLIAWSRVQLATLAIVRGRLDDAWALLDGGWT
jgi:predicted ATPase